MNQEPCFRKHVFRVLPGHRRFSWFLRLAGFALLIGALASGEQVAFAATGRPDASFLRVTPSSAVVAVGEPASFAVVDESGRPVPDARWSLSDPIANLEAPLDGAVGGIGLHPKSPGRAVLTAFVGGLSATASVSVVEQKDLVAPTVVWSLDPWPGYEALVLRQAAPSPEGPDFIAVEWSKTLRAIVRGLKSDGRQMWLAHLSSMASPLNLKRRQLPTSGKLYLAGKELKGSRDMLLGEDHTFFLGGLSDDGSIGLKPGEAPVFVRDSGDDWGGLVFLERSPVSDALVDLSGSNGSESWRFTSAGRLAANWTVNQEGDVAVVETLCSPASASLLVLDGHSGAIRFRVPFPTSSSKVENFKCIDRNEILNVRASRAGSVFTSTDGKMYVQVEVHDESATACGSQQGSHSFENTLSLLQVAPDGTFSWRVIAQIHSDGNSLFHAQERVFAGESIPDGLGGVLAAWTYFFPGVKGGEKARVEARVSRVSPKEQRDYTLPMANWTPGLTGLFDENMVLGEEDVLYATNGKTLVSFHIPSGEIKWVRQPPAGGIKIQHSTSGGGILVANQERLTYFDAEGRGADLPWTVELPESPSDIGLSQTDLFAHTPGPALALREVELYSMGRFIGVEDGSPAGQGRFLMFLVR
jgi:hypothetical protein